MRRGQRLLPWAAAAAVVLAFLPALGNGFVNWDDDSNFLLNPYIRGFTWRNIRWMLTAVHNNHYHPLTWLSLALDRSLWGSWAGGVHLTSVLLHAANAGLFCLVAERLYRRAAPAAAEAPRRTAAAFAGLLFGLHPLRVESVAWASERRDVLSGLFYLLAILFYLKAQDPGETRPPARCRELSLAAYAASLLSKAIGVTLPAALLLLDLYPLKRLSHDPRRWLEGEDRAVLREKLPYAVMALATAALGLAAEARSIALHPAVGLAGRAAVACYGLVFYVVKSLLPVRLLPLYPIPKPLDPLSVPFPLCAALVLGATAALAALARRRPQLLAAWGYYALTLLPVSGIIQFGPQLAADRYSYLPCLSLALLAAAPLLALDRLPRRRRELVLAATAACAAGLGVMTWEQTRVWRDSETLWSYTAAVAPRHWVARNYLGNLRYERGDYGEAALYYTAALALKPDYAAAHNNLGNAFAALRRLDEALVHYRRALELDPAHPALHYNIGGVLAAQGRWVEAAGHFREELALDPDSAGARRALAQALEKAGRPQPRTKSRTRATRG